MFSELIGALTVSKSIGITYSWKEIYVSNLQQVFSETCLEDADLSKPQGSMQVLCCIWTEEIQAKTKQ